LRPTLKFKNIFFKYYALQLKWSRIAVDEVSLTDKD
jgi:hypothetical protein